MKEAENEEGRAGGLTAGDAVAEGDRDGEGAALQRVEAAGAGAS